MLALTPAPLQTAGEREFFGELGRWDTGNGVRAAVVASLPFVDGPLQRRLSDAVLFLPEGVAVVRVVEVVRQAGVVTAGPEGPWTIGPEGRPGAVLQLGGGGSTPLDGLMRAGMETAVRLRDAGLEPGRIARLTVLVGDVSGLVPADGDLGEGDQVALLEPRSLLLGIARASRYTGTDNLRLWTTADVRAALEALGLDGRPPSVEALNGEGFAYSPYVLRRRELMTPSALAAVPADAAPQAPGAAQPPSPAVAAPVVAAAGEAPAGPAVVRTTAPVQGAVAPVPPGATAAAAPVRHDTVAIDGAPEPRMEDTGGLGGLFANGELVAAPAAAPPGLVRRGSAWASQAPTAQAPTARAQAVQAPTAQAPAHASPAPQGMDAGDPGAPGDADPGDTRSGPVGRALLLVAAALVVVLLLGFGGWQLLREPGGGTASAGTGEPAASDVPPTGPEPGEFQDVDGVRYTVQAVQVDDTCVGHAYGEVADFLAATDCTGLSRALYSAELAEGAVVVSVSRVQMPDTTSARALRDLTDRNGTGNVSDLLREGVGYSGGPESLSSAEYASAVSGPTVTIVESSWTDPDSGGSAATVDLAASQGLELRTLAIAGG